MMGIGRRTVVTGGGAAVLLATAGESNAAAQAAPVNTLAASIGGDGKTIKLVRVFADDGRARIAEAEIPADASPYPLFKQFLMHKASATAIYGAPPNHKITIAPSQAKDLIFIAAGSTNLTAGSDRRRCGEGSFILFESGVAHAEQAGPNGYTAIKIRLAD